MAVAAQQVPGGGHQTGAHPAGAHTGGAAPGGAYQGGGQAGAGAPEGSGARRGRALDSPSRLWLMLVLAVAAVLALGCVAGVGLADRGSTARHTDQSTEALYTEVQDLAYDLADANAAAATSLLVGSETPAQFSTRFDTDITKAEKLLAAASQRVADDPYASAQLSSLAAQIPVYTGLIGQAQADNRFGYPVAGAFLREASSLLTGPMRAETDNVINEQKQATTSGISSSASYDLVLLIVALVVLWALVMIGRRLARMTHRRLNPGLIGGGLAVVVLLVWSLVAFGGASGHASSAQTDFGDLSQAKKEISQLSLAETYVALQQIQRGEDVGSDGKSANAGAAQTALKKATPTAGEYSPAAVAQVQSAAKAAAGLSDCENAAIKLASDGRFSDAVTAAVGDGSGGLAVGEGGCEPDVKNLHMALSNLYKSAQTRFDADMSGLSGDYEGSAALPLGIALGLLGAAAAAYGLNRRLAEFR